MSTEYSSSSEEANRLREPVLQERDLAMPAFRIKDKSVSLQDPDKQFYEVWYIVPFLPPSHLLVAC